MSADDITKLLSGIGTLKSIEAKRASRPFAATFAIPVELACVYDQYESICFIDCDVTIVRPFNGWNSQSNGEAALLFACDFDGGMFFLKADGTVWYSLGQSLDENLDLEFAYGSFKEFLIDKIAKSSPEEGGYQTTPGEKDESCETKRGRKTGVKTILNQLRRWFHPQKKGDDGC